MKKLGLILLLFASSNIKSQNLEYKDEVEWNTYVCGEVIEDVQALNDSLNVTPNPFQKRTSVYYSFSQNDTVSLTVYDRWGQSLITVLSNSVMPSGIYQDSLIMDAFPDGIYVVILKLGNRRNIGKAIAKAAYAGITELSNPSQFKMYPNPVSNTLYISTEQNGFENAEIEIINPLGQVVLKTAYSNKVYVSGVANGSYILQITTINKTILRAKFIKE